MTTETSTPKPAKPTKKIAAPAKPIEKTPEDYAREGQDRRARRDQRTLDRRNRRAERQEKKNPNKDPQLEQLEAQVARWVQAQVDSGRASRTRPIANKTLSATLAYLLQQMDLFYTQQLAMHRAVEDAEVAREKAEARAAAAEAELGRAGKKIKS